MANIYHPLFTRATLTFLVNETLGIIIVVHELFFREGERPTFLALAGVLMGLPFVLAADGLLTRRSAAPEEEEEDERWSHLP